MSRGTEQELELVRTIGDYQRAKLAEERAKSGWRHCDMSWLIRRLREEVSELCAVTLRWEADPEAVWREAGDVANVAAMIADVYEARWDAEERECEDER